MKKLLLIAALLFAASGRVCAQQGNQVIPSGSSSSSSGANASTTTVIDAANPTYGMKWDGVQVSDATFTVTSPNVSSNTAVFTQADVGKTFYGYPTCGVDGVANGQSSLFGANTTILTVTNSHNIVVSSNSAGSVAGTGCFVYGTLDDTGLTAVETAANAAVTCPTIVMPAKIALIKSAHFIAGPASCANSGPGLGGTINAWGENIVGQGQHITILAIVPDFLPAGCTGGASGLACFGGVLGVAYKGFSFDGGGNSAAATFVGAKNLFELGSYASLTEMGFMNFGGNNNFLTTRFSPIGNSSISNTTIGGWGTHVNLANGSINAYHLSIQDSCPAGGGVVLTVAAVAQFYSYGGWYASGTCNVSTTQLVDNLGIFRSFGDTFFSDQGGTTTTAQALTSENGATTTIIGSNFLMNQGASSNAIGNNGTATVFVQSSKVIANNGAIFGNWIDGGQNVFGGGSVSASFGSASITGTACATGNWALTSGWGTSSIASVTAGGDSHRCQVVITGAAGSASPVLTWTFPTAYKNAPGSCMLTGYPGVAANLTGVSTGAPGATNVAFTFTGTPVAQTYRFDVACGP